MTSVGPRPSVDVAECAGTKVLTAAGELDMADVQKMAEALEQACRDTPASMVIDMSKLTSCRYSPVILVALAVADLRKAGCEVALIGPDPLVQHIFEMARSSTIPLQR